MYRHMTLRCSVIVVTTEYAIYNTTCLRSVCGFSVIIVVQFNGNVTANVSCYCISTLTATVCIVINGTAGQLYISVLFNYTHLATAIDITGNGYILCAVGRMGKDVHQCSC